MIYAKRKSVGLKVLKKSKITSRRKNQIRIRFISTQNWPRSDMKMSDCDFCCTYQKQICVTTVMGTSPYFIKNPPKTQCNKMH